MKRANATEDNEILLTNNKNNCYVEGMRKHIVIVGMLLMLFLGSIVMIGCNTQRELGTDFSYERISVTLTQDASVLAIKNNHTFSINDFQEIDLIRVDKAFIHPLENWIYLFLWLKNPGRENVLEAITIIGARSDVEKAGKVVFAIIQ